MRLRLAIALTALAIGSLGADAPAAEQTMFRPVAVVNDTAITGYDLAQRSRILEALGHPADSPDALRENALDQLVDEKLKLQAAQEMRIEVTPEMVEAGMEELARRAGTEPDALRAVLNAQGVAAEALEDMARAEVGWLQVIRTRFAGRMEPGEAEIDSELALLGNGATTEHRVLEIGLPLEGEGRTEAETRALAEQLYESLSAGGSFEEAVARYSSAPSAAQGGEVGWVSTGRMAPELRQAIDQLEVGQVSRPLSVSGGISIVKVVDRRTTGPQPQAGQAPTRETVRRQLVNQRSTRLAEGLLQEMRRDALIEVR